MKLLTDVWARLTGRANSPGTGEGESGEEYGSPLMELLPYLLLTGLASVILVLLIIKLMPTHPAAATMGGNEVVTFDIIKYANAQRAVASKFLGRDGAEEAAPILLEVSKKTRATIEQVAGPGTIVVVRQALVYGDYRDITDDVLILLGLPTDVPTQNPTTYAVDFAPTMMSIDRAQREAARQTPAAQDQKAQPPNSVLP